jgi:hypothetical protein
MPKNLISWEHPMLEELNDESEKQQQQYNSNCYTLDSKPPCAPGYILCRPYHLCPRPSLN